MKSERVFFGLSLGLLTILAVACLFVSKAGARSPLERVAAPLALAPVLPTPTPAPLPPGWSGPGKETVGPLSAKPDLVVEKIEAAPSVPLVSQPTLISVTIRNIGQVAMQPTNNFYVDFYLGGAGAPSSGQRGIDTHHDTAQFGVALPWGCQGFWVGAPNQAYVLTATVVFTQVRSYYLYAQIDTPEVDKPLGNVIEDPNGGRATTSIP